MTSSIQTEQHGVTEPDTGFFVGSAAWKDSHPDCLLICCSDHRYEGSVRELANHLGFSHPHVIQFPGGASLVAPLAATLVFLPKAIETLVERAVTMKGFTNIVIVGHQDCGAYKESSKPIIDRALKFLTRGKSVHDLQLEHLLKAARQIKLASRNASVKVFFAEIVGDGEQHIKFSEVPMKK